MDRALHHSSRWTPDLSSLAAEEVPNEHLIIIRRHFCSLRLQVVRSRALEIGISQLHSIVGCTLFFWSFWIQCLRNNGVSAGISGAEEQVGGLVGCGDPA